MSTPKFQLGQKVRLSTDYVVDFPKRWKDPVEITRRRKSYASDTFFYCVRRYTKSGGLEYFSYEIPEKSVIPLQFGRISLEEFL